jgi:glutamate racemase
MEEICEIKIDNIQSVLKTLLKEKDDWILACVHFTIGNLRLKELSEDVVKFINHPDELIRETSLDTLRKLEYPDIKKIAYNACFDKSEKVKLLAKTILEEIEQRERKN